MSLRNRRFFDCLVLSGLASLTTLLLACSPESINREAEATYQKDIETIRTYVSSANLRGTTTSSGLFYAIPQPDTSAKEPVVGEELEVRFRLSQLRSETNGQIAAEPFDTSFARESAYFSFFPKVLLTGLEEGIGLMHEGESAVLLMPSRLAYGNVVSRDGRVQPNTPLRCDVQLIRSRTEAEQMNQYQANLALPASDTTDSGVRIIKLNQNPGGATPTTGQTVTLTYSGKRLRGVDPFAGGNFQGDRVLGRNQLLPGLEEAVLLMKEGEKAIVLLPSARAYGVNGLVNGSDYTVPPYSPLVFTLELSKVL